MHSSFGNRMGSRSVDHIRQRQVAVCRNARRTFEGVMTLSTIQTPILVIGSFLVLFLGLSTLGGGSVSAGWADMMDYCGKLNNGYGTTHMFHWEAGDSMYQEYPGFVVFIGATIIILLSSAIAM